MSNPWHSGGAQSVLEDTRPVKDDLATLLAQMESRLQSPVLTLLGLGQSNMASSDVDAAGGDLTPDPRIRVWTGAGYVMADPANGVGVPASGRNSILFQMAKQALRRGYSLVYIVITAHPGQAIAHWTGNGTSSAGYVADRTIAQAAISNGELSALGVTQYDAVVIQQGESDGGASFDLSTFQTANETWRAQLRAETWASASTSFLHIQLSDQVASHNGPNTYFTQTVPTDADPYSKTIATAGLHPGGADGTHWPGTAMDAIGARAFDVFSNYASPQSGAGNKLAGEFVRLIVDQINGKGLGLFYNTANDQVLLGGTSTSLGDVLTAARIVFDLNDGFVRADSPFFAGGALTCLDSFRLHGVSAAEFNDATSTVNTVGKAIGTSYTDAAGRTCVASGPAATDPWKNTDQDVTFYTPT